MLFIYSWPDWAGQFAADYEKKKKNSWLAHKCAAKDIDLDKKWNYPSK